MGKVWFIGAGPGDPELLTIRALKILEKCRLIIYPGSLINEEFFDFLKKNFPDAELLDSAPLILEEIFQRILETISQGRDVARLVSGSPAFYSAIQEQIELLRRSGIPYEVIPGISSGTAGACRMGIELTYPELSHTVIFTRFSGKTGGATPEEIKKLTLKNAVLVFFLSTSLADKLQNTLLEVLPEDTPIAIVYRVYQSKELIFHGTLHQLTTLVDRLPERKTALIYVGNALKLLIENPGIRSKLYGKNKKRK